MTELQKHSRLLMFLLFVLVSVQVIAQERVWPVRFGFDDAGGPPDLDTLPQAGEVVKELGCNLWVHHLHFKPQIAENIKTVRRVDDWCGKHGLKWMCSLEGANWRQNFIDEKGRDWYNREDSRHFELLAPEVLEAMGKCKNFLGVMYDEAAHMQNCRNRVAGKKEFWKPYMYNPDNDRLEDANKGFTEAARGVARIYGNYGIRLYTEQAFPVMFHGFARAGFTAGPKVLKESWSPVYLACAMGAAIQYGTQLWVCADLWFIGDYPGHSPEGYRSALLLAYHMGADSIYTENIAFQGTKDTGSLVKGIKGDYKLTEHGKITKWFSHDYMPAHPRNYHFSQLRPRVAIIRQEDGDWGQKPGCWPGARLFGHAKWKTNETTDAWLKIWHLLTRGVVPVEGMSWWTGYYKLPYQVFCPMEGVVVFDHTVGLKHLKGVEVIFLTGLGVSSVTLKAVERCVANGATCVALPHLVPKRINKITGSDGKLTEGKGSWVVTKDFLAEHVRQNVRHVLPKKDIIRYRFGKSVVEIEPVDGDMNRIKASVENEGKTASGIVTKYSEQGEITGVLLGSKRIEKSVQARTLLYGCQVVGSVSREQLDNGGVVFRKQLVGGEQKRCTLIERFEPAGDSIRWEIEIVGQGRPWSAPIQTQIIWPDTVGGKVWSAWGAGPKYAWHDPLVPKPFSNQELIYGASRFSEPNAISIPMVTVLDEADDLGMSLVLSPEDLTLDMKLRLTATGEMSFFRTNLRISDKAPVRFVMHLVAHEADWRSGLGWVVERYRSFFEPPNPTADQLSGCASYSAKSDEFDAVKLKKMGYRLNWEAAFDWPYIGMYLPPVKNDTEQWVSHKGATTSIKAMRERYRRLRAQGFYVLSYFNVNDFGRDIEYPIEPRMKKDDPELWKDGHSFLYHKIPDAILLTPEGKTYPDWEGCIVTDPGEPAYQAFLLEQAQLHIDKLPESSGICIDRMDRMRFYNPNRDDGVSMYQGKPAASLMTSWHEIMSATGRCLR
ncbi:MAG: hypothetical protein ACYTA5_12990 [Planctomycetota bacterium]|jgi:hypothetical protein